MMPLFRLQKDCPHARPPDREARLWCQTGVHRCPLSQALSSEKVQGEGCCPDQAGTPVGFLRPLLSTGFSRRLQWWQRTRLCAALRMKIWSGAWLSGGAGARRSLTYSTSALSSIQQKFKVIFLNINSISSLKSFNDFSPTLRIKFLHEVAPASFSPSSHLQPHCNHLPDPVA